MCVNSLFEFGEAVAQPDNFLAFETTVLDYTQAGFICCKLEKKHACMVTVGFGVCAMPTNMCFSSVNISASHPS